MKAKQPEPIKLSIGMIVKNEERCLRRCLESLQPLMKEVRCELIIADTGSEDKTREIAEEFTDQVFDFVWCNDFGAARNSTLDRATGEWYLFLDADEWLIDWKKLANFLSSSESRQYNSALIRMRNYLGKDWDTYQIFSPMRMIRRATGSRFINKIHEVLVGVFPQKKLDVIFDHDGYAYQSPEELEKKSKRNRILIEEELKEHPDNVRTLGHMADIAVGLEGIPYLKQAKELVDKNPQDVFFGGIYNRMIAVYLNAAKYEEAEEICNAYFDSREKNPILRIADIDISLSYAGVLILKGEKEKALPYYLQFLELLRDYEEGKTSYPDESNYLLFCCSPLYKNRARYYAATILMEQNEKERFADLVNQIELYEIPFETIQEYFKVLYPLTMSIKDKSWLTNQYQLLKAHAKEELYQNFVAFLTDYYFLCPESRESFVESLSVCEDENDLIEVMQLLAKKEEADYQELLIRFLENYSFEKPIHTEAVWAAILQNIDLSFLLCRLSADQIDSLLSTIAKYHADFLEHVGAYTAMSANGNLQSCYFLMKFYEKAAIISDQITDKDEARELDLSYLKIAAAYLERVYSTEALSEQNWMLLPPVYHFVCIMASTTGKLQSRDELSYVSGLNRALKVCPQMKSFVELLLDEYNEKKEKEKNEMDNLAYQFKEHVQVLIEHGMEKEAMEALNVYAGLNPKDADIEFLYARLGVDKDGNPLSELSQPYIAAQTGDFLS